MEEVLPEVTISSPLEQALEMVGQVLVHTDERFGIHEEYRIVDIDPTGEDGLAWNLVLEKR